MLSAGMAPAQALDGLPPEAHYWLVATAIGVAFIFALDLLNAYTLWQLRRRVNALEAAHEGLDKVQEHQGQAIASHQRALESQHGSLKDLASIGDRRWQTMRDALRLHEARLEAHGRAIGVQVVFEDTPGACALLDREPDGSA
jgi:hypothetical protein